MRVTQDPDRDASQSCIHVSGLHEGAQAKNFCLSWCRCIGAAHFGQACFACSDCIQQGQHATWAQGAAQAALMGDTWHTAHAAATVPAAGAAALLPDACCAPALLPAAMRMPAAAAALLSAAGPAPLLLPAPVPKLATLAWVPAAASNAPSLPLMPVPAGAADVSAFALGLALSHAPL